MRRCDNVVVTLRVQPLLLSTGGGRNSSMGSVGLAVLPDSAQGGGSFSEPSARGECSLGVNMGSDSTLCKKKKIKKK